MNVHATLRRLRMSPRKVRLVVDLVRGLPVEEAEVRLSFLEKRAALPVLKLLKSAVANATHNFKLDPSTLIIKEIAADGGPTYKRWRPRAFGRAGAIRKRTTHISLVLAPREGSEPVKQEAPKSKASKKEAVSAAKAPVKKEEVAKKKTAPKGTTKKTVAKSDAKTDEGK